MTAMDVLEKYGISMEQAFQWIAENISSPTTIFNVCKFGGLTTAMVSEIIDTHFPFITTNDVKSYFSNSGLDYRIIDGTPP